MSIVKNCSASIVIPTYNRIEALSLCLEALSRQPKDLFEVIIVDASREEISPDILLPIKQNSKYIKIPYEKRGQCYQRNIGIQEAKGDIIVFIDDDSIVHDGWLNEIIATYINNPKAGAVGGRALRGDKIMWDDISPIGVVRNDGFLTEGFDGDPGKLIEVEHLIGCNMSFRKDVLHKIGYIDEIYGQGGRWEVDLTLRAIMAGYKVLYNPKAVVDHLGSPRQEIKRFSLVYNFRMTRNHCYLLVKNFGLFNKRTIIYILKQITQVIFKAIGRALKGILSIVYTVVAVLIGSLRGLLKK